MRICWAKNVFLIYFVRYHDTRYKPLRYDTLYRGLCIAMNCVSRWIAAPIPVNMHVINKTKKPYLSFWTYLSYVLNMSISAGGRSWFGQRIDQGLSCSDHRLDQWLRCLEVATISVLIDIRLYSSLVNKRQPISFLSGLTKTYLSMSIHSTSDASLYAKLPITSTKLFRIIPNLRNGCSTYLPSFQHAREYNLTP